MRGEMGFCCRDLRKELSGAMREGTQEGEKTENRVASIINDLVQSKKREVRLVA